LKKFVFNAFKVSLGCVISITICTLLDLKYGMSAGLLTVLSIQDTKRETIDTALKRLYAFFCAFFISVICFRLMGFNAVSFGIYLFIFVNICIVMNWKFAIVPVSVLVTHMITEQSTDIMLLLNEFLIFLIGAGMGILINMHLKRNMKKMSQCRAKLDLQIKKVIEGMSVMIVSGDKSDYNGECFRCIDLLMFEAQQTAYENYGNKLRESDTYDLEYLKMRKKQCSILYEMYKNILKIDTPPEQADIISDFLKETSVEYHEQNDVKNLMNHLEQIFFCMQSQPMPRERSEFENRAVLYSFMLLLREFLVLKYEFVIKINGSFVEK